MGTPHVIAALATSPPAGPAAALAVCTTVSLMDSVTLPAVTFASLTAVPALDVLDTKCCAAVSPMLLLTSVAWTVPLLPWVARAPATMAAPIKIGVLESLEGSLGKTVVIIMPLIV